MVYTVARSTLSKWIWLVNENVKHSNQFQFVFVSIFICVLFIQCPIKISRANDFDELTKKWNCWLLGDWTDGLL